jgi:hypothetical protein
MHAIAAWVACASTDRSFTSVISAAARQRPMALLPASWQRSAGGSRRWVVLSRTVAFLDQLQALDLQRRRCRRSGHLARLEHGAAARVAGAD